MQGLLTFFYHIYFPELEITDTTNMVRSTSYLERNVLIRDNLNFHAVNFPFICSHIPAAFADGAYVSQLKRCSA
jgi:hypothetical protein